MNNFFIDKTKDELQIKLAIDRTPIVVATFLLVVFIGLFWKNSQSFPLDKVLKVVMAYLLFCAILMVIWLRYRSHHFKIEGDAVIFNHKKQYPKYVLCGVKLTNVRKSGGTYKIELLMHAPIPDYTIHYQVYEDDAKKIGTQIASFFEIPFQLEE